MNKGDLVGKIAKDAGLTKSKAEAAFNSIVGSITASLKKGQKVTIVSKEEQAMTTKMMKPLLDEHVANMKKLGLPGEESLKFLQDWLKANP